MSIAVTVSATGSHGKVAKVSEFTEKEDNHLFAKHLNKNIPGLDKYFSTSVNSDKKRTILVIDYENAPVIPDGDK